MHMEQITINLAAPKVRRETMGGRTYLVAPLTMIVPGVLAGSKGPLYYPLEEIEKSSLAWNHMPILLNHPYDAAGNPVSGRDPEYLGKQALGIVLRSKVDGKLTAEGWFDEVACNLVDRRIVHNLESGQSSDLSTGLFTDNEPAGEGAVFNDRPYTHVARNYRPDHLAILLDKQGACSRSQGCGVLINQGDRTMPLTAEQKQTFINNIASANIGWSSADVSILGGLTDEKLTAMNESANKAKQLIATHNAAIKGFTDPGGNSHTWNEEKGVWEHKAPEKPTNNASCGCPTTTQNSGQTPPKKEMTYEEWFAAAPPRVQATFNYAAQLELDSKSALADRLVANRAEADRPALKAKLMEKSLSTLKEMAEFLPPPAAPKVPNYYGAGVGTAYSGVTQNEDFSNEALPLPTINYDSEKK